VCPLQCVKFALAVRGRCCHIAKRADGIYRFIRIDAVEELVIVHSPTCIIGLHDWIPKRRGCTGFEQTEVASPQPAFQQRISSHPALLETAKTLIGPNETRCPVVISLIDRTTTLRKTLRPPVQNLHATLAAAGIPSGLFSEGAAYLNRQPRHSNPIHIPHTSRTQRRNQNDTFRSYTQSKGQTRPGWAPLGDESDS
jgi:hypothetical protein